MVFRDIKPLSKKEPKATLLIKSDTGKQLIRRIMYLFGVAAIILLTLNSINIFKSGLRLQYDIVKDANAGFEKISNGAIALNNSDFENAKKLFIEADEIFKNIKTHAWFTQTKLPYITINDPVFEAAKTITDTGLYIAQAGEIFSSSAKEFNILSKDFFSANIYTGYSSTTMPSLTEKLKKQLPALMQSADLLAKANLSLKKMPETFVPASLRERFHFAKNALTALSDFTSGLQRDIPAILALLGDQEPHTYLILLQNNAELRPTGGFIGNYMIMETNDGYLTKNNVFDIYSADHQLAENLTPPREIMPANNRWFMRDSNYSAHFPLSAEKAAWFLEKEGGPGVDTVIAIDQNFVTELLRRTGPIKIPELTQSLTSENFSTIVSYIVESKISGREDPKTILRSFMPAFTKALFKNTEPVALLSVIRVAIKNKHVLAYSKNPSIQAFFENRGLAGLMKKTEPKEDFLNIQHTSISGNKSDDDIAELIGHDTYINLDGSLSDELSITRIHTWNTDTEKNIKNIISSFGFTEISERVWRIFGRSPNVNMLRIYVPKNSVIEDSAGSNVETFFDEETGKTYFSARIDTPLGGLSTLKLRYKLPFKINLDPADKYFLSVQSQAGQSNVALRKRIFAESGITNYKYFPSESSFDLDGVLNFETQLEKDMTLSSIWGK